MVDEDDLELASIPRIHDARAVHHADTMIQRQAAPRSNEPDVALRNCDRYTGRDRRPPSWIQLHALTSEQIDTGILAVGPTRYGNIRIQPK